MIDTLDLRSFRILRSVEARLSPLTVIVGPNSSGKSSVLQALYALGAYIVRGGDPTTYFQGERHPEAFQSRSGGTSLALGCSGRLGGCEFNFFLSYGDDGDFGLSGEVGGEAIKGVLPKALSRAARPPSLVHLDVRNLSAVSHLPDSPRILPGDGTGMAAVLAGLHLEYPARFRELVGRLREVVPTVEDLRVRISPRGAKEVAFELLFDMLGAEGLPAKLVSDGTLLSLGLLTILTSPEPPRLILIDDLERGLHPRALGDLVQQLRKLQEQEPELQIVATSHSPYLLDFLKAEEILLTSLDDDGYAAVRPLTEHPDYERWKDLMAPGEFWSAVGEKWVTEGRSK